MTESENNSIKNAQETNESRELTHAELNAVSGGDKARAKAVLDAKKVIEEIELLLIDVEPVPYVPMKL